MDHYFVTKNAQKNGEHEVHTESCDSLPSLDNRRYLGFFPDCYEAFRVAREIFSQVNECKYCSEERHKR